MHAQARSLPRDSGLGKERPRGAKYGRWSSVRSTYMVEEGRAALNQASRWIEGKGGREREQQQRVRASPHATSPAYNRALAAAGCMKSKPPF